MSMPQESYDIYIWLNSDRLFTPADSQALEKRLRAETDLRGGSEVTKFPHPGGGYIGPPGDVVIAFYTVAAALAPVAQDVLVSLLSSALFDVVKASLGRRKEAGWGGGGYYESTIIIQERDKKGQLRRAIHVTSNDPEIIKEGIRRYFEDD